MQRRPISVIGFSRFGRGPEARPAPQDIDVFARQLVHSLFIGKSGAILLGFPDTTEDADLFVDKSPENCTALIAALREFKFTLTDAQSEDIRRGKDVAWQRWQA